MECSEGHCHWYKDKVREVEDLVMVRPCCFKRDNQSVIATQAYKRYEPCMHGNVYYPRMTKLWAPPNVSYRGLASISSSVATRLYNP